MKHTPGPWKVVNAGPHWNNKATTNYQIQYGDDGECISDHVYEAADAQLIAAAPDLLAVCENLVMLKDLWLIPEDVPPEHQGEAEAMHRLFSDLKVAIGKAAAE